jgi:hypothetical protein
MRKKCCFFYILVIIDDTINQALSSGNLFNQQGARTGTHLLHNQPLTISKTNNADPNNHFNHQATSVSSSGCPWLLLTPSSVNGMVVSI